jgi:hypothetical protein
MSPTVVILASRNMMVDSNNAAILIAVHILQ